MTRAYDDEAARIGARSFTRPWRFKLLGALVASMAVVPMLARWFSQ